MPRGGNYHPETLPAYRDDMLEGRRVLMVLLAVSDPLGDAVLDD